MTIPACPGYPRFSLHLHQTLIVYFTKDSGRVLCEAIHPFNFGLPPFHNDALPLPFDPALEVWITQEEAVRRRPTLLQEIEQWTLSPSGIDAGTTTPARS